jgi:succinyl-CoA synthetase alpha subunit
MVLASELAQGAALQTEMCRKAMQRAAEVEQKTLIAWLAARSAAQQARADHNWAIVMQAAHDKLVREMEATTETESADDL